MDSLTNFQFKENIITGNGNYGNPQIYLKGKISSGNGNHFSNMAIATVYHIPIQK